MTLIIILLWVSAAWLTFGALATVAIIGKPRIPVTAGSAVFVLIATAVIVGAIVAAAITLA